MRRWLRRTVCALSGALIIAPAIANAEELGPRLSAEARLRYELAEDADAGTSSDALAARLRTTAEAPLFAGWSALGELEFIGAASDEEADQHRVRPLAHDIDAVDLNRLQLHWTGSDRQLTLGRQRIELDDSRFLGSSPFRLNDRTFDAATGSALIAERVSVEVGAFWRVQTPAGPRSDVGVLEGESWFLNASAATGLGQMTAFHYALDLDDGLGAPASNARSSATTGLRIERRVPLVDYLVDLEAAFATQTAFAGNPTQYDAEYYVVGVSAVGEFLEVGARYEELGADEGGAFQTPLANLHAFNGRADIFTTTPDAGLIDATVELVIRQPGASWLRSPALSIAFHDFEASRGDTQYGREWDVRFTAALFGQPVGIEYADYRADRFPQDTRRLFVFAQRRF